MKLEKVKEFLATLPRKQLEEIGARSCTHHDYIYNCVSELRSRCAIEVGTFRGLNSLYIAAACEETNDLLYTININHREVECAKNLIRSAGLTNVEFFVGDSINVLRAIDCISFDFAFIDGNHSYRYSHEEFTLIRRGMKKGIILLDDANYIHPDGQYDGGVPQTVKEVGAVLVPGMNKLARVDVV